LPVPRPRPRVEGYFRVIGDMAELDRFKEVFTPAQSELYKEWLVQYQDRMLAFISADRLVSWAWFTTRREMYYEAAIQAEIPIPPEASFHFDAHTVEAYQRKGIYTASFYEYPSALNKFGKKKLIFLVRSRDKIPMANANKFHFRRVKKYTLLNLGLMKIKFSRRPLRSR